MGQKCVEDGRFLWKSADGIYGAAVGVKVKGESRLFCCEVG
jgi:hypothetical protein